MNRRQFLHVSALGAALLAGCSGGGDGTTEPVPKAPDDGNAGDGSDGVGGSPSVDLGTLGPAGSDLQVTEFDYGPDEDGNLTVTVGAKNTDDEPVTVVLVQSVSIDGNRVERSRTLTFQAGGRQTVTMTFDVAMSTFDNASSTAINGPEWQWPEDESAEGS